MNMYSTASTAQTRRHRFIWWLIGVLYRDKRLHKFILKKTVICVLWPNLVYNNAIYNIYIRSYNALWQNLHPFLFGHLHSPYPYTSGTIAV